MLTYQDHPMTVPFLAFDSSITANFASSRSSNELTPLTSLMLAYYYQVPTKAVDIVNFIFNQGRSIVGFYHRGDLKMRLCGHYIFELRYIYPNCALPRSLKKKAKKKNQELFRRRIHR